MGEIVDVEFNNGLKKQAQKTRFMLIETPTLMHELASQCAQARRSVCSSSFCKFKRPSSLFLKTSSLTVSGLGQKDFWRHEFDPDPRPTCLCKEKHRIRTTCWRRVREGDKPICHHLSLPRTNGSSAAPMKKVWTFIRQRQRSQPRSRERKGVFSQPAQRAPRRTLVLFSTMLSRLSAAICIIGNQQRRRRNWNFFLGVNNETACALL